MSKMTSRRPTYEVVLRGPRTSRMANEWFARRLPKQSVTLRVSAEWSQVNRHAKRDLYILIDRGALLDEQERQMARRSRTAGEKRFLVLPDDSPSEAIPELICGLSVRTPSRLHTPRLDADDLPTFVHRFLTALSLWPTEPTIADAWIEGVVLVLLSPTLERLKVPIAALPKISQAPLRHVKRFEIDDQGEFIYWPSHDVHMGWAQFEQIVKPHRRLRAQQASDAFNRRYGRAVRQFREEAGLRQSDIPGLDARTIRRIEHGRTRATAGALQKLAQAHRMSVNDYLDKLSEKL